MTVQPSYSRFQLLDRPIATPSNCAVCGTTEHPVVDFGLNIDYYGAFYLCVRCLAEGASVIGMVSSETYADLEVRAEQSLSEQLLQRNLVAVTDEWFESASSVISGLSTAVYHPDVFSDDSVDGSAGEEVPDDVIGSESVESDSAGPDESDSGQDDSVVSSEGPVSIPADSSDERVEHFSL